MASLTKSSAPPPRRLWSTNLLQQNKEYPAIAPGIFVFAGHGLWFGAKGLAFAPHCGTLMRMDLEAIAFEHAPIGLAVLENRTLVRSNLAFGKMFGVNPADCVGRSLADFYASEKDFRCIGERVYAAIRETGHYNDERVMRRGNGALFWCRVRGQSTTPENPFQKSVWSFADLSEDRPIVELTQREREVAILTCRGLTSKEIGLELKLSYRTIEEYRARLLRKFGARKLAELVAKLSGMPL